MKADKREIVTFVIAALATLVAVWFFLGKMQKEKDTVRTDLYTFCLLYTSDAADE